MRERGREKKKGKKEAVVAGNETVGGERERKKGEWRVAHMVEDAIICTPIIGWRKP